MCENYAKTGSSILSLEQVEEAEVLGDTKTELEELLEKKETAEKEEVEAKERLQNLHAAEPAATR